MNTILTGSTTLSPPRGFRAIFLDRFPHHLGARRMTCLAGLSFWDGRDILIAGPTFLQKKTLWLALRRQPVASNRAIRACASRASASGSGKGVILFPAQTPAKDELGWDVDPSAWDRFSPYKRGLIKTIKLKLCCQDESVCYGESRFPRPSSFKSNGGRNCCVIVAVS